MGARSSKTFAGGGDGFGSAQIDDLSIQEDSHLVAYLSTQAYLSSGLQAFDTA